MKLKFLEFIFSVKNIGIHKQFTLFGTKLKFKSKKLVEKNKSPYRGPIVTYDVSRQAGIDMRMDNEHSQRVVSTITYQTLNKLKEMDLKRKIRENKKVKVVFLLDSLAKFSGNSVYHSMKNHSFFEPVVVLCSIYEKQFDNDVVWNKHLDELETLKNSGYEAYSLYDENRCFIPIDSFKPDILFVTTPYFETYGSAMHFSNIFLNVNYLVCYMSYGWIVANNYEYYYNNRRIDTTWKNFVFSKPDFQEFLQYSCDCGLNCVLSGYPKLDVYSKPYEECKIPKKIDNGNPVVIYAPHWSVVSDNEPADLSTFHLYYDYFLNLVKNNPDINFVFKPHPSLGSCLNANKIMSYDEYDEYIKEWDSLPNGYYEMGGEYIDLFRKSNLLITDSQSFIAEYLPSDNPCMYLVKPTRYQATYLEGFSISARKILEKYYLCHNLDDIENNFNMIVRDKQDPIKEERIKLKDDIFVNIGCAGQKIVDYLTEILLD